MLAPFESSRLKIARARRHIEELETAVASFLVGEPFLLVVEQPEQYTRIDSYVWTVRMRATIPTEWSAVVGDIVHNLRTALDLMASDLVRIAGRNTKGVYFPFADSAAGLPEMIKRKNFDRAGIGAIKLLKTVEPYRGGNEVLRALHDLDVKDKHQALLPCAQGLMVDLSTVVPSANEDARKQLAEWGTHITHDGQIAVVILARLSTPVGSKNQGEVHCDP